MWARFMDEDEYEDYLNQIDNIQANELEYEALQEQLRDEHGHRVSGCYRTRPAPPAE